MLQLRDIKKTYISGDEKVEALKGINLDFRESEFVSILGQSGCGKTTLLNIVGGLDRYTSGDLIINGKSTKDFKDRDWDAYRNYTVGFIFQSYNLISHQSVLSNVELALTLAGVSKEERRERAIKALDQVGLKDKINKKPNQLSGGQMQRVAIARALVNDPDIILADEPTGALDSKTSEQVMEILKEISKDKLIIMVTHNADLAERYSNRIIRIKDGLITDDSNPIKEDEVISPKVESGEFKRTSMKFFTAFRLSLNNLMTKKARTILTAFAGSIGIIGIALILAISSGIQDYIDKIEEDTLSSYPVEITSTSMDISSMMETMMGVQDEYVKDKDPDTIYSANVMNEMLSMLSEKKESNNLEALKEYIETTDNPIKDNSNAISYSYDLNINLYKEDPDKIVQVNPSNVFTDEMMSHAFVNMSVMPTDVWYEMLDNQEILEKQYNVLAGHWPENYNEVVLIVGKNFEISDYTLYALGLKDQEDLNIKMNKIMNGETIPEEEVLSYSYDDLLGLNYKIILESDYYDKTDNGVWVNRSDDEKFMQEKIKNAPDVKVVGVITQNDQSTAISMSEGIGYTKDLKEFVINKANESEIAKDQKAHPETNVFSGLEFPKEIGEKVTLDGMSPSDRLAMLTMSPEDMAKVMQAYTENATATLDKNMIKMGAVDIDHPQSIRIYPKDFESKDLVEQGIKDYNALQEQNGNEENVINYTDFVGAMMKSVNKIIEIISYVLIAFVGISLVVSSIMIGIITYISVLERTKEIGLLRAVGASKKDISRVFNAETLIVGLIAGLIGIFITFLLTFPINHIILLLTDVVVVTKVPLVAGIFLVLLSVGLTVLAGLIPSKIASRKDPVVALRTE